MAQGGIPMLLLHGPNLNLLGRRAPEIYGRQTLAEIEARVQAHARQHDFALTCAQSNSEGRLVDLIHEAQDKFRAIVINPGAYAHTSLALADAISAVGVPTIEVHLSNVYRREAFRHHSYISAVALGVIAGLGAKGYLCAVDALAAHLQE